MSDRSKATPPKSIGEVAVEKRFIDSPDLLMLVNFKQDGEEYAPNQNLADALKLKKDNDIVKLFIQKEDYRKCQMLNTFFNQLLSESDIDEDNTLNKSDINQATSLLTFIVEASKYPEYCTTSMLRKFSNVISGALEVLLPIEEFAKGVDFDSYGFYDMADDKGNASGISDYKLTLYGQQYSITPEMLRKIHDREWKPASDMYRCQSDNLIHLRIQICYAILMHYFRNGDIIRICKNCGRIFIPSRASDKYCTGIAPQEKNSKKPKSCGQYMKYQKQRIHNDSDEFKKEHDRILRRLDSSETQDFIEEYKETKGNPEARRQMLERWAEKYPPRRKKGEAK